MQDRELYEFLAGMGLPPLPFSEQQPLALQLDGRLTLTLEYSAEHKLVLSLTLPMRPYASAMLEAALRRAAFFNPERELDFTAGYARDRLLLLTQLNDDCSAAELESAAQGLIGLSQELEAHYGS